MSIGRWIASQWPYLLGATALGGVVAVAIATRPKVGPASDFVPPVSPKASPHGVTWVLIEGSPVRLQQGRRYRGCISVPFIVPTGMVVDKLPSGLAERGFTDIVVSRPRPSDWPDVDCDIHVEVTWSKPDEALERPGAVELAWVGEPRDTA